MISFSDFKREVYRLFRENKRLIKREAQELLPEVKVVDVRLSGSYGRRKPTEESDIDIRVIYKGNLARDIVWDRLIDKLGIPGLPGALDIHVERVE